LISSTVSIAAGACTLEKWPACSASTAGK
jgi:hypothetical protein